MVYHVPAGEEDVDGCHVVGYEEVVCRVEEEVVEEVGEEVGDAEF